MNEGIQRADAQLEASRRHHVRTVAGVQKRCTHKNLAEADYRPSDYGAATPPMMVCRDCGMTEDGWGSGYRVLRGEAVRISRDQLYKLRRGLHIDEEMKGPLNRKEVTVHNLVDAWKASRL